MKFALFSSVVAALSVTQSVVYGAEFEWAGAFLLTPNDPSHTWSMQATGDPPEYADPSMRLVFFVTVDPSPESIEDNEENAKTLITGADCKVVNVGDVMELDSTKGTCYELTVGPDPDSLFPINTTGISGITVFAQHFPIEFERDMHYLKDSLGNDIEPAVEEGGGGHDHAHDHGHSDHGDEDGEDHSKPPCACAADEFGFKIDCAGTAAMVDSFNFMKSNGCGADCTTDTCQEAWYIVQAHHDYCDVNALPTEIEDGFHDFDEACKSCAIARDAIEGAPDCPEANCEDQSGNEAYAALVENSCADDCSSDACKENYLTLRIVHDDCPHDTLSTASEEGLHDFEDICKVPCNTPASKTDQLTCAEPAAAGGDASATDTDAGTSGAAASMATGACGALFGAAMLLA